MAETTYPFMNKFVRSLTPASVSLRQPPSAPAKITVSHQPCPAIPHLQPHVKHRPTGTQLEIHAYNKGGHNGKKNTSVQLDIVIR